MVVEMTNVGDGDGLLPQELVAGASKDNGKGEEGDGNDKVEEDVLHQDDVPLPIVPSHPIINSPFRMIPFLKSCLLFLLTSDFFSKYPPIFHHFSKYLPYFTTLCSFSISPFYWHCLVDGSPI